MRLTRSSINGWNFRCWSACVGRRFGGSIHILVKRIVPQAQEPRMLRGCVSVDSYSYPFRDNIGIGGKLYRMKSLQSGKCFWKNLGKKLGFSSSASSELKGAHTDGGLKNCHWVHVIFTNGGRKRGRRSRGESRSYS